MKFKIGDKCEVLNPSTCLNYHRQKEAYCIIITKTDKSLIGDNYYDYDIVDKKGNVLDDCFGCFEDEDLKLIPSKTNKELDDFQKVIDELISLKESKAGDYQNSWKVLGIEGLNYQLARKFTRIWINRNKEKLNNEVLRDSYVDLAVYAIMCIQLLDSGEKEDKILEMLKG